MERGYRNTNTVFENREAQPAMCQQFKSDIFPAVGACAKHKNLETTTESEKSGVETGAEQMKKQTLP